MKTSSGRERELFINIGQDGRARAFLRKRTKQGKSAEIKEFEVDPAYVDNLRKEAVLESDLADFPGRPVRVDVKTPDQFGLKTPQQIQALRDAIVPGSGRTR